MTEWIFYETAVKWYPHRERLTSINPNGIAPWDWDFRGYGPEGSNMTAVAIWSRPSVAWHIYAYRILKAKYSGQAAGEFKT